MWHDSVLHVLLSTFQSFLSSYTVFRTNCDTSIKFVKAGSKPQHSIKTKIGLLHFASDWILQFDHLDNKLVIPSFITVSQLRPDIAIYSISTKTVILLKLTCHCEENIWGWHNKKFVKYHSLSLAMVSNGWSVHWFPIKVGARGYCSVTVKSCIMRLGFCANLVKFTLKSLSLTSLKASFQNLVVLRLTKMGK